DKTAHFLLVWVEHVRGRADNGEALCGCRLDQRVRLLHGRRQGLFRDQVLARLQDLQRGGAVDRDRRQVGDRIEVAALQHILQAGVDVRYVELPLRLARPLEDRVGNGDEFYLLGDMAQVGQHTVGIGGDHACAEDSQLERSTIHTNSLLLYIDGRAHPPGTPGPRLSTPRGAAWGVP